MPQEWLDRTLYPFTPHYMSVAGGQMHYVDEGQGRPIVFVHGTPTWSFMYRDLIKLLATGYRCIAPDHIGFGLSDKPTDWTYRPEDHAHNLATFIEKLELQDIILVVHDFGGPIGLSYAIENSANITRLVIFNSWLWSLTENQPVQQADRIIGGPLGKWLYTQVNLSPRFLLPTLWANKATLTPAVRCAYTHVHRRPQERLGMYQLARALLGSTAWYEGLWQRRQQLAAIPTMLLWGLKDATFGSTLERWHEIVPHANVVSFPTIGHFVVEEESSVGDYIKVFLAE